MPSPEITQDEFLGGRLTLRQPRRGYRAGVDPVLLAASVPAKAGQRVLDLGCGVGAAALCLAARVPGLRLWGLELQPDYAALARQNAADAGADMQVVEGDLTRMPAPLRDRQFDHVLANPPYFRRDHSTAGPVPGRETAMGEGAPLADWVRSAAKRTAPGGTVTFILRAERLPELMEHMSARLGSLQLMPLVPRPGRDAQLFLMRGRKNGRAAFRLHSGLLMHENPTQPGGGDDYTPHVQAVLREAAALDFPA